MRSPPRVSSKSVAVRMKRRSSPAISRKASPIRGAIPSSVALTYSSSTTMNEMVLACSVPSLARASSWIFRSASLMRSSPVSRRRTVATVINVPSLSFPVNASSPSWSCGGTGAASISACETDSKLSTCKRSLYSSEGPMRASLGVSSGFTAGSSAMSMSKASICERPAGVIPSPRKRTVVTRASPESEKSLSISSSASATALPCGSVSAVSGGGARRSAPAPSATVMTRSTRIVTHGRAVTSRLSQSSTLLIASLSPWDNPGAQDIPHWRLSRPSAIPLLPAQRSPGGVGSRPMDSQPARPCRAPCCRTSPGAVPPRPPDRGRTGRSSTEMA